MVELTKQSKNKYKITQDHKEIVHKRLRLLKHATQEQKRKGLAAINRDAAVRYSVLKMRDFVISDFHHDLWDKVIDTAQDNVPLAHQNHLHCANTLLSKWLGEFVQENISRHSLQEIIIVEGGVGGANTTHQVIRGINSKLKSLDSKVNIKYKGFEINPSFAGAADLMLKGTYMSTDGSLDARSRYFQAYASENKSLFEPLANLSAVGDMFSTQFVECLDLADGVELLYNSHQELVLNSTQSNDFNLQIDLFLCSYVFHHVPNGRHLRDFLFGEGKHASEYLDLNSAEGEAFINYVTFVLKKKTSKKPLEGRHPVVSDIGQSFVESLRRMTELQLNDLLGELESIRGRHGNLSRLQSANIWVMNMVDHQTNVLDQIFRIMRPGGVVAFADPDGTSNFNFDNIENVPEMTVAHFLKDEELVELLQDVGFEILDWKVQYKIRPGVFEEKQGSFVKDDYLNVSEEKGDLEDPNLGYIVIARRPLAGMYINKFM